MADTVPPKPPGQRRRRNKPPVAARSVAADAKVRVIPELPGDDWEDWTRDCWRRVWESPMAVNFIDVDFPALVRLMQLQNRVALGTAGVQALAEMRQLEDRFGLSPLSRRRLQIEIEPPDTGDGKVKVIDEKRWLRVVGGDGE